MTVRASGTAVMHAAGVAGDLGDRGVGQADAVAAVAGGHDAPDVAALQTVVRQQPVKQVAGQRIVIDALVARPDASNRRLGASTRTTLIVRDPASIPAQIIGLLRCRAVSTSASSRVRSVGTSASVTGGTSISTTGRPSSMLIICIGITSPSKAQWLAPGMREITTASASQCGRVPAHPPRPIGRRPDHRIGQRHPRQRLHRRQVLGNLIERVAEHEIAAAQPPAALLQQVHHPQIGHRIDPEDADGVGAPARPCPRLRAARTSASRSVEHGDGLLPIGAEVDRQHLGDEHLQGRQRAASAR